MMPPLSTKPDKPVPKINILVSYEYWDKRIEESLASKDKSRYRLMIDSGAFTAWKQGKQIKLDDYAKFLDRISYLRPFHAIQLDVVGDEKKTRENYLELKRMGFETLPVFTRGSSRSWLEECYEHTDYVLLGGVASGSGRFEYVDYFESINKGRKQHWLGVDKIDAIKHHKPFSVDSSNFMRGAYMTGEVSFYCGLGAIKSFSRKSFVKKPSPYIGKLLKLIGFDVSVLDILKIKKAWTHTSEEVFSDIKEVIFSYKNVHGVISIISYVLRALDIEKKVGTMMYLSARNFGDIEYSFGALDHLISENCI